jgi:hypothetical protein
VEEKSQEEKEELAVSFPSQCCSCNAGIFLPSVKKQNKAIYLPHPDMLAHFLSHVGQQQMSQLRRSTKRQLQVLAFVACTIGAVYYLSTRDTEAQHEEAKPWDEPPVRVESRRIGNA